VGVCTIDRPDSFGNFLESLAAQRYSADELIVIDASRDARTERTLRGFLESGLFPRLTVYERVSGAAVGLTRQRNRAVRRAEFDLLAFFDDDIVLQEECLEEMERVHRAWDVPVAGVAAAILTERTRPTSLWRLRRFLRIVPTLEPGRYCRSGMSTPWSFLEASDGVFEGEWLPGGATMWRTEVAQLGFDENFAGYGQGEDLEFSLRARRKGKLLLAGAARVRHDHTPVGRPNHFRLGYMAIRNRYIIHRTSLPGRSPRDVALFAYAWTLDTLLLFRHLARPRLWASTIHEVAGRIRASLDLVTGR